MDLGQSAPYYILLYLRTTSESKNTVENTSPMGIPETEPEEKKHSDFVHPFSSYHATSCRMRSIIMTILALVAALVVSAASGSQVHVRGASPVALADQDAPKNSTNSSSGDGSESNRCCDPSNPSPCCPCY